MTTEDLFQSVSPLLNGKRLEEKVAGVLLVNKFLDSHFPFNEITFPTEEFNSNDNNDIIDKEIEVIKRVVNEIKPIFLINMVASCCNNEFQEQRRIIQDAAMFLLSRGCRSKYFCGLFSSEDMTRLIEIYFQYEKINQSNNSNNNERSKEILLISKSIACKNNSLTMQTVHILLEFLTKEKTIIPSEMLKTIADMITTITITKKNEFTVVEKKIIRSLLIQGLHGAAPEKVRDQSLRNLSDLFYYLAEVEAVEDSNNNNFPVFLCSIVKGEMHLLQERLLSEDADKEDLERCINLSELCLSLFDKVLLTLVDDRQQQQEQQDHQQQPADLHWDCLHYEQVLKVKKILSDAISEMFEFLKELSPYLEKEDNKLMLLLPVVQKMIVTISGFASEDDEILDLLVEHFERVCQFSSFYQRQSLTVNNNKNSNNNDYSEDVFNTVLTCLLFKTSHLNSMEESEWDKDDRKLVYKLSPLLQLVGKLTVNCLSLLLLSGEISGNFNNIITSSLQMLMNLVIWRETELSVSAVTGFDWESLRRELMDIAKRVRQVDLGELNPLIDVFLEVMNSVNPNNNR